jgi:hypothetical protein
MGDSRTVPEVMGYEYTADKCGWTIRVRKVCIEAAGDVPADQDVSVWEASGKEWPALLGMGYGTSVGEALADLFRNRRDKDDLRSLRYGEL